MRPDPPIDTDDALGRSTLTAHRVTVGTDVEVELTTPAGGNMTGGRVVEGTVTGATGRVLLIDLGRDRLARIPWPAITIIRDAIPTHPGL